MLSYIIRLLVLCFMSCRSESRVAAAKRVGIGFVRYIISSLFLIRIRTFSNKYTILRIFLQPLLRFFDLCARFRYVAVLDPVSFSDRIFTKPRCFLLLCISNIGQM